MCRVTPAAELLAEFLAEILRFLLKSIFYFVNSLGSEGVSLHGLPESAVDDGDPTNLFVRQIKHMWVCMLLLLQSNHNYVPNANGG